MFSHITEYTRDMQLNLPMLRLRLINNIIAKHLGSYLVVITKKTKVGDIHGQDVWRVTATEVLPFKRTTMHLTEQQVRNLPFDHYIYIGL